MLVPMTFRRALLALAVVVHLVALYAPRLPSTGADGVPASDKLGHVAVFGAVALTGMLAGLPARRLVPALLAHALVSELVQHWLLPDRTGDPVDVVADVAGVAAGWWLGDRLSRRAMPGGARGRAGRDR